ncbi:hypothetical protein J2T20_004689 [Paenibacillus wynnii]|nr:hypothetical protein [Paenibacillus wynnii]
MKKNVSAAATSTVDKVMTGGIIHRQCGKNDGGDRE